MMRRLPRARVVLGSHGAVVVPRPVSPHCLSMSRPTWGPWQLLPSPARFFVLPKDTWVAVSQSAGLLGKHMLPMLK